MVKDREKVCRTHDAINMDDRNVAIYTRIIRCHNPHPVVRVRLVTEH